MNITKKYKVRRYGFHGTSHSYVSKKAAEVMGRPYEDLKTIVCHLGNGSKRDRSHEWKICRYFHGSDSSGGTCDGKPVPEILIRRSWSSSHRKRTLTLKAFMNVLNKKSGVFGLSGELSSDFRDLTDAMNNGDKKAKIAMDVFLLQSCKNTSVPMRQR